MFKNFHSSLQLYKRCKSLHFKRFESMLSCHQSTTSILSKDNEKECLAILPPEIIAGWNETFWNNFQFNNNLYKDPKQNIPYETLIMEMSKEKRHKARTEARKEALDTKPANKLTSQIRLRNRKRLKKQKKSNNVQITQRMFRGTKDDVSNALNEISELVGGISIHVSDELSQAASRQVEIKNGVNKGKYSDYHSPNGLGSGNGKLPLLGNRKLPLQLPLPLEWQEFRDQRSGITQYLNSVTGDLSWSRPSQIASHLINPVPYQSNPHSPNDKEDMFCHLICNSMIKKGWHEIGKEWEPLPGFTELGVGDLLMSKNNQLVAIELKIIYSGKHNKKNKQRKLAKVKQQSELYSAYAKLHYPTMEVHALEIVQVGQSIEVRNFSTDQMQLLCNNFKVDNNNVNHVLNIQSFEHLDNLLRQPMSFDKSLKTVKKFIENTDRSNRRMSNPVAHAMMKCLYLGRGISAAIDKQWEMYCDCKEDFQNIRHEHLKQQQKKRGISDVDLKTAIEKGTRNMALNGNVRHEYKGIVYIATYDGYGITTFGKTNSGIQKFIV